MSDNTLPIEAIDGINRIKEVCNRLKPLVAINCTAYNHELYIRDALEGFVNQKTNFPFVAIVHEDASTDGTANFIREYAEKYPDIILTIFEKENQYSQKNGSLGRIMDSAIKTTGAKYVAMCEGDDYWTDPHKLQKQVDFLESHTDYSMCFHNAITIMLDGTRIDDVYNISGTRDYSASDILRKWTIPTASVVFRTQNIINDPIRKNKNFKMGDNVLFLTAAKYGRIYGFDEYMSIYRRNYGGATVRYGNIKWARVLIDHYKALDKVFSFLLERGLCKEYIAEKYIYLIRLQRKEPIKVLREVSCALRDAPIQFVMGSLKAWIFK